MAFFPPELRRYRLLVVGSSSLLAAAGGVALFLAASPGTTVLSRLVLVFFALVVLPVSGFALLFVPRWYRRAAYVVSTGAPAAGFATLVLESDSDSTSLYATVSMPASSALPLERIALLMPRWDVRPFLGASLPVGVHIDPSNSRLMALSSEPGVLWCMPTGRAVRSCGAA